MSLKTLNLNASEIAEGIAALEKLKHYTVRGHGGDIAENLHRLRKKWAALVERRKVLDEVYIRTDLDGESIPDSKPRIDADRYIGAYKPDRKYKPGAILSHKGVMFEVQKEVKGIEPPGDDAYVAVGKVVEQSFRVKDGYQKDVIALETEPQRVYIRTVPKSALDAVEELPAVAFWMPMLEMEEEEAEEVLSESKVSENGQLVETE